MRLRSGKTLGSNVGEMKKKKKKLELNDLPMELLIDIISRLPITSIVRAAKFTCKLWKGLISDPMFLESYPTENPGCLYRLKGDSDVYFAVNSIDDKPIRLGNCDEFKNMNLCRGLMCNRNREEMSINISNPIIGDVVKIPSRHFGSEVMWGFGYAPLSKRYKLFQVCSDMQRNRRRRRISAVIFTLGEPRWKHLDPTQFSFVRNMDDDATGEYCNGALYCIVPGDNKKAQIMSFDLETEKVRFRRPLPVSTNPEFPSYSIYLTLLGETLGYVMCALEGLLEIWTLVDEVEAIWAVKYRISKPTPGVDRVHFSMLGLWLNNELYGVESSSTGRIHTYVSYRADSKTYVPIQLPWAEGPKADGISPAFVTTHGASLVSPSKIVATRRNHPSLVTG